MLEINNNTKAKQREKQEVTNNVKIYKYQNNRKQTYTRLLKYMHLNSLFYALATSVHHFQVAETLTVILCEVVVFFIITILSNHCLSACLQDKGCRLYNRVLQQEGNYI